MCSSLKEIRVVFHANIFDCWSCKQSIFKRWSKKTLDAKVERKAPVVRPLSTGRYFKVYYYLWIVLPIYLNLFQCLNLFECIEMYMFGRGGSRCMIKCMYYLAT